VRRRWEKWRKLEERKEKWKRKKLHRNFQGRRGKEESRKRKEDGFLVLGREPLTSPFSSPGESLETMFKP
jgi:hypothetical protein